MDKQSVNTLKHIGSHRSVVLLALVAFLLFSTKAFSDLDFQLPPDHQSTYSIEKFGTHVGNMHSELRQNGDQVNYTSTVKAVGFAALFVKNDALETSNLSWFNSSEGKTLRQQSYHLFRGKKHKKNQDISFDWSHENTVKLNGSYKNRNYELASEERIWGRHLLPLLLSNDLLSSKASANIFYITDKGGVDRYNYTLEKTENISVSGSEYPALKFKTKKEGSRRMSYIWVSKAHYYQPLKIEQYKDNKLHASMLMTKFELTRDKPEPTIAQEEVEEDYD